MIVSEVELKSEDQILDKPVWVAEEVTNDVRYFNANLVKNPFSGNGGARLTRAAQQDRF